LGEPHPVEQAPDRTLFMTGNEYQSIEQNDEKPSQGGKLARMGHRVVQLRDLASQRYVVVVVDDSVREYRSRE